MFSSSKPKYLRDTDKENKKMVMKKAQIWVETAIYTLIGLTIIAILLSIAMPQIDKIKDKSVIKQTIEALNDLDNKLLEIEQSPGNVRVVNFKVGKGKLEINPVIDTIIYTLENTKLELSEPGKVIPEGPIFLETEEYGSNFNILLYMIYSDRLNITYGGSDENIKTLQAGVTSYKIQIENMGSTSTLGDAIINIDFNIL